MNIKKIKVAAVQMKVTHNPDKNIERILYFLNKAANKKVNFVCFPEASLINGWEKYQIRPIGKYLKRIKEKCKKEKINCVFGSFIKERKNILNVIFFIDEFGKLKYRYEKIHLWKTEKKYVKSGRQDKSIKTKYGKIGLINCHDIDFPELTRKLVEEGAEIIFCPAYDLKYKKDNLFLNIAEPFVRACDNEVYFVFCDAYSKETNSISGIYSPEKILKTIKKKEGMIRCDLNFKKIKKIREQSDLLK